MRGSLPQESAVGERTACIARRLRKEYGVTAKVLIYTTGDCPYCHRAKQLLGEKKVSYTEVDVDERPDLRSWLASATGQRTVPQVFINGRSVGGFSDIDDLDQEGELDRLLAEAPAADSPALPV